MSDHAWKAFEREVASAFNARRYWANSGELIDVEGPTATIQCKLVQRFSLDALSDLAEVAERQGLQRFKHGLVAIKCRRGHGRASPILIVQTLPMWRYAHGPTDPLTVERSTP